jgi:KaiC/GvpD/RAD55 family RecA-like ATPase
MKKIQTGIYGLDYLLDGGINENSATIIIGPSGTGKTTFTTQFLRKGVESGENTVFITLEEDKDQIIKEAKEMGWDDIEEKIKEESLEIIEISGKEFSDFIVEVLPSLVSDWEGTNARIVVDPLTPVIWSTESKYEQRELISILLRETKKVGAVIATLEEHGAFGNLSGSEAIIPMYLADSVIHLSYVTQPVNMEGVESNVRSKYLEIIKCRSSWHSQISHPYHIINSVGIVIQRVELEEAAREFPETLKADISKKLSKLPASDERRMLKLIQQAVQEKGRTLDTMKVVTTVLREHGIDMD